MIRALKWTIPTLVAVAIAMSYGVSPTTLALWVLCAGYPVAIVVAGIFDLVASVACRLEDWIRRCAAVVIDARDAALGERLSNLEQLLRALRIEDGILRARGLVISDDAGSERITLGAYGDGRTVLMLESPGGRASITAVVSAQGTWLDFWDPAGIPRIRSGTTSECAWLGLHDADDKPRAGLFVNRNEPGFILTRAEPERHPPDGRAEEQKTVPGYL